MDILTLKSKVNLGCNQCDKCCVYRGDIRLTPINVCNISKFLKITIPEFIENYTDRPQNNVLELVLKTVGDKKECILYDKSISGCFIHSVKPMQCVMFPLVPENLKRDYFYNSEQCNFKNEKEISVNDWLNGNNKIYKKNKDICIEWIKFLEWAQEKIKDYSSSDIDELYKILFENYDLKKNNLKKQMFKNMIDAEKKINKTFDKLHTNSIL